jgi:homoaconitase/3-isopropylmalate dehydratase large subunit
MEFGGSAIRSLSTEARTSISNMAIESGARTGVIVPDDSTFDYLKVRSMSPSRETWDKDVVYWRTLTSDEGAAYDKVLEI